MLKSHPLHPTDACDALVLMQLDTPNGGRRTTETSIEPSAFAELPVLPEGPTKNGKSEQVPCMEQRPPA